MKIILALIITLFSNHSFAGDVITQEIIIKNHRFNPNRLKCPSNRKIELVIKNQDNSVEEFESFDLKREKIIPSMGQKTIKIGPLKPGEYKFFGEFHEATAQGTIIIE